MKNKNGRRRHNKQARDKAADRNGDRFSKLPDDLLLNILERVDTLDAIRTCILSKQLLKLPTMLSHLFISVGSISCHYNPAREFSISDVLRISHAIADVTDNILSTRSPEITISKLKIRFVLTDCDSISIGKSVARAMATQRVDEAEFEMVTEKAYAFCSPDDLLHFAGKFNTFLGACPDAFAGLTHLWLRNLRFGEHDIPIILSTCKRLKSSRLTQCDAGIHSVLQIEHDQLVELVVNCGKFERIELTCLPKLQRVNCMNWFSCADPLSFGFVPVLSKLSLTNTVTHPCKTLELSQLLANVPSMTDLYLDFQSEKIWVLPERPKLLTPVLRKLQQVNLEHIPEGCDFSWTMFILEAAPSLKDLCITVWDHSCKIVADKKLREQHAFCEKAEVEWNPYVPDFKHKNLVKLRIYGFQPDTTFMRYIRRVAEVAVNMVEISLHDGKTCWRCGRLDRKINACPSKYPRTTEERKQITEELGLASPAMIHFRS
uniref:Uncharacterized protein n=1 Tax=Avena sativa TaxID=4498 RepID=A0ACD5YQM6_AVESA